MLKNPKNYFEYEALGTNWQISIWDNLEKQKINSIFKNLKKISLQFDNLYSRFIKKSLITKLSKKTGIFDVPEDLVQMLKIYQKLFIVSDEKINPLIGFTISDLGYDINYTLIPKKHIRQTPNFNKTIKIISAKKIEIKEKVLIDLGALGKGFLVDKLSSYLKQEKIKQFLVNGSGDIFYQNETKEKELLRVGLEHPKDDKKIIGVVDIENNALCASGSNRRTWNEYNHFINPKNLETEKEIIATWVVAQNTAIADGLATALFFNTPEIFQKNFEFEYLILNKDFKIKKSKNFKAELF